MPALLETNAVNVREDLADKMHVADVKSTPVLSMAKKGEPLTTAMEHSWPVDEYDTDNATTDLDGVPDGKDIEAFDNPGEHEATLTGRAQKFRKAAMVGDIAQNINNQAGKGPKQAMAKAVAKKLIELKRRMERRMCSDLDSTASNGVKGSSTRGLGSWISSSVQSDNPVPTAFRTEAGAVDTTGSDSIRESHVQNVLQAIYEYVGEATTFIGNFGPTLKRVFSEFANMNKSVSSSIAALRTFNQEADRKKIVATIDFYEGDFGSIEIHPSVMNAWDQGAEARRRRGYLLWMEDIEIRYGRYPRVQQLEDKNGGPRAVIDAIAMLVLRNPKRHGKFAGTGN